jgi:Flp pilus assembly protein TadG
MPKGHGRAPGRRRTTFGPLRRIWGDDRASSAVEFAMCAPILLMLSLGTIEVGRVMLVYHNLSLAAFEAGRFAMVHGNGSGDPVTEAELKTLVGAKLHGADPAQLELDADWDPDNNPGSFVTITLQYPFESLVGFLPSITLSTDVTTIIAN